MLGLFSSSNKVGFLSAPVPGALLGPGHEKKARPWRGWAGRFDNRPERLRPGGVAKRFSVTLGGVFQGLNQGPGVAVTASRNQQADLIVKLRLAITHPRGTVIVKLQVVLIIFGVQLRIHRGQGIALIKDRADIAPDQKMAADCGLAGKLTISASVTASGGSSLVV